MWNVLKRPLLHGGLGLRLIVEMNQVLQGKWIRRFMNESGTFWRRIIESKFGTVERDCLPRGVTRPHGIGVWKKMCMGRESFQ